MEMTGTGFVAGWARPRHRVPCHSSPWCPSEFPVGARTRPQDAPGGHDGVVVEGSKRADWHCLEVFVVLLDLSQALKAWIWARTFRLGPPRKRGEDWERGRRDQGR